VRDTGARRGELADLVIVHVDRVRIPDVVAEPSHGLHPGDRAQLVVLERVALLVEGLAQVRVHRHPVLAGEVRRLAEQVR
jgi:hypothetical protein